MPHIPFRISKLIGADSQVFPLESRKSPGRNWVFRVGSTVWQRVQNVNRRTNFS